MTQETQYWRVSVTATPRGDWLSPGGQPYNFTLHDGATAEMTKATVAVMDELQGWLTPANGNGNTQQRPNTPPVATGGPPQGEAGTLRGMDVYGVGFVAQGEQFVVGIDRVVASSTTKGKSTFEVYRPGNQWKFATVFEQQFDKLEEISAGDYDPPVEMVFAVGKQKKDSTNHHMDFAGLAYSESQQQPPAPHWPECP